MKTLSVIVPCFDSAEHMRRSIDSALLGGEAVEVIIVDDGSTDSTGAIADEYAARHPGTVRAVHRENGGHGPAVDTGVSCATAPYLRVLDSDDRFGPAALARLLDTLDRLERAGAGPDLVVTNFVYEKPGRRRAVRYRSVLPRGRVFGWEAIGRFRPNQYLLMHALTYRTDVLRSSGLRLPAHTSYVDNLFASIPLTQVRSLFYLDVDLYRYEIGRPDQSVNESVMLRRLDQQLRVTELMRDALPASGTVPPALREYMVHYFGVVSAVTSLLLIRSGTAADLARHAEWWESLRRHDPDLHRRVRRSTLGRIVTLPGPVGRRATLVVYRILRWFIGFN